VSFAGLKHAIKDGIRSCAIAAGRTRTGRVVIEQLLDASMSRTQKVSHGGVQLVFAVPNALNHFRTSTFSTKEPETLSWIDTIPEESVVWDVGANIGLYSCYAAKARRCRVIAFEPSVFNLELLARNIFLNALTDRITIVSLPLYERVAESTLNMTCTQWGGALSSFGTTRGFDGENMNKVFEFRTIGLPMDEAVSKLDVPYPDYIKMDVDGIEHMILSGGTAVLKRVRGISIEVNDAFADQAFHCRRLLEAAGLHFVSKAHSEMIENIASVRQTFNQVWVRR
jgi:FkbM family methyltransferase